MGVVDAWDPGQYGRFREERQRPFRDLLAMVQPHPGMMAVDLGCGTGDTTRELHTTLGCQATLGVDASPAMLAEARAHEAAHGAIPGLRFVEARVEHPTDWSTATGTLDLIFSNACLQWVPEHVPLLATLTERLAPGGQLAVQMPVNDSHPSHAVARELASEAPYNHFLRSGMARPVLPPEQYARLLHRLGFTEQRVLVEVYGHLLDGVDGIVAWVQGSVLTEPRERLPADLYARFEADYRHRLSSRLVDERPTFYPFKRLLLWARR